MLKPEPDATFYHVSLQLRCEPVRDLLAMRLGPSIKYTRSK